MAVNAPRDQAADPQHREGGDKQAIPGVARAPRTDMLAAREEQFLPPHLDHVVDALADTTAVDPLHQAPRPAQCCPFSGRVGRPDVVAALQVREAVVREVMADVPQAERCQRGQERDPADPFIQFLVRRVRAVAGIVPDHEQARDPQRGNQRGEYLDPHGFDDKQARNRDPENHPVEDKPDHRRYDRSISRERLQQFREHASRGLGDRYFRRRRCLHHPIIPLTRYEGIN